MLHDRVGKILFFFFSKRWRRNSVERVSPLNMCPPQLIGPKETFGINQATAVRRPLGHWQPLRERILVPTKSWLRTGENNAHWWWDPGSYHLNHSCCSCEDRDSRSPFPCHRPRLPRSSAERGFGIPWGHRLPACHDHQPQYKTTHGGAEASITSSPDCRLQRPSFAFWSVLIYQGKELYPGSLHGYPRMFLLKTEKCLLRLPFWHCVEWSEQSVRRDWVNLAGPKSGGQNYRISRWVLHLPTDAPSSKLYVSWLISQYELNERDGQSISLKGHPVIRGGGQTSKSDKLRILRCDS